MYSFIISLSFVLLIINVAICQNSTTLKTSISSEENQDSLDAIKIKEPNTIKLPTLKNLSKALSSLEAVKLPSVPSKSGRYSKKSDSSNDDTEEYEDGEDYDVVYDNEGGGGGAAVVRNVTQPRHIYVMKRQGITYAWGRWGKWSRCLNSCVQIRKRQCIKRLQNSSNPSDATEITFYPDLSEKTTGCVGIMKKYRLCKDEKCMKYTNSQMRNEQCSAYNREPYKGKFYNWLGYEKEHNECELYCMAMDSDIFISMNQSVTDGTPCGKPSIYYTHYYRRKAVCVEGICKVKYSIL